MCRGAGQERSVAPDPPPRFLSSATRVMSQSSGDEDLAGLADATQDNVADQEMGSPVPSSPELICSGCRKSSKSNDPIAKKRKSGTEATMGVGQDHYTQGPILQRPRAEGHQESRILVPLLPELLVAVEQARQVRKDDEERRQDEVGLEGGQG